MSYSFIFEKADTRYIMGHASVITGKDPLLFSASSHSHTHSLKVFCTLLSFLKGPHPGITNTQRYTRPRSQRGCKKSIGKEKKRKGLVERKEKSFLKRSDGLSTKKERVKKVVVG